MRSLAYPILLAALLVGLPPLVSAGEPHRELQSIQRSAAKLGSRNHWDDAIREYQRATDFARSAFGSDSEELEEALLKLAKAHSFKGDLSAAWDACSKALALSEKRRGPNDPANAAYHHYLAKYSPNPRIGVAEAEHAIRIMEGSGSKDNPALVPDLNWLAGEERLLGNWTQAEVLYKRSLSILDAQPPGDLDSRVSALLGLALIAQHNGDGQRSESFAQTALGAARQGGKPALAQMEAALEGLAEMHRLAGKLDAAQTEAEHALAIARRLFGPNAVKVGSVELILGRILSDRRDYLSAATHLARAHKTVENAYGPEHLETAIALQDLAQNYRLADNPAKAEALYHRVWDTRRKLLGLYDPATLDAAIGLASSLEDQHQFEAAVEWHTKAVEISERVNGTNTAGTATRYHLLAICLLSANRIDDAEKMERKSLAIRGSILPRPDIDLAISHNELGRVLLTRGTFEVAKEQYLEALSILNQMPVIDNVILGTVTENLAEVFHYLGRDKEAEQYCRQSLDLRLKLYGVLNSQTIKMQTDLAVILEINGRFEEAEKLLSAALGSSKQVNSDKPAIATILSTLSEIAFRRGDYTKAEEYTDQALAIRKVDPGPRSYMTALSLNILALIALVRDDYDKADRIYSEVQSILEEVKGKRHSEVAVVIGSRAQVAMQKGDYSRAEELFREAISIGEEKLGKEHPQVAIFYSNFGLTVQQEGKYSEAEQLYRCALRITVQARGESHPDVAQVLNNLGNVLGFEGDLVQAEVVLRHALEIWVAKVPDSPNIGTTLSNLGNILQMKGEYTEAKDDLERALALQQKAFGKVHRNVAMVLNGLCELASVQGDQREAEDYCKRGLDTAEAVLGKLHPDLMGYLNNLANVYVKQNRVDLAEQALMRDLQLHTYNHRSDQDPTLIELYSNFGLVYTQKGEFDKALEYHKKAMDLATAELGAGHFEVATLWINTGDCEWARGSPAEALADFVQAARIEEKNLAEIISTGSERERLAYVRAVEDSTSEYISLNISRLRTEPIAARLALESVLQRKARQIEAVATSTQTLQQSDPATRALLDRHCQIVAFSTAKQRLRGRTVGSLAQDRRADRA
jgi:tetratricopeptide (TPR) repeat protein